MEQPTDKEIELELLMIMTNAFNRSLNALENAGAVKTTSLFRDNYRGIGSKFYDLVTEQMMITIRNSTPPLRQLFAKRLEQQT